MTTPSPYGRFLSWPNWLLRCRAYLSISTNDPSSRSRARRSRAVFLPRACCFSTARSDPACATSATRRLRSASLPAVVCRSGALASAVRAFSAIHRSFALRCPRLHVGPPAGLGRAPHACVGAARPSLVKPSDIAPALVAGITREIRKPDRDPAALLSTGSPVPPASGVPGPGDRVTRSSG
ncbi:hypothetical protein BN12_410032 [Nostocoides japonicum T1-X7]|uniref:Uncharacterized protein n=1 Tax=Nostocoides japonicum T1-X7 TaxID=1194083 RepID=A0A077M5D2_9MICO|nr:hypothetical protein BN12_410032 [Tetrasphaera japonica T1-X7]